MKKLMNKKGFTLMEMLIVVAIIVILVAIAIPTFSSSLDDAKAATDAANLRGAKGIAEVADMTMGGWEDIITNFDAEGNYTLVYDIEDGVLVLADDYNGKGYGQYGEQKGKVVLVTIADGAMTDVSWGNIPE